MAMVVLFWLITGSVIVFVMGLFGVLVPGPQWWRKSRSRAAQIMGGAFAAFIIFIIMTASVIPKGSDTGESLAPPTPSASREPVPETKIVQEDTALGTIIRRQDVPPGSALKVVARRHGEGVLVQLDTNLPKNTMVSVSIDREYYEVGNPEIYSQEYFSEKGTIGDWTHARTFPINNATWMKKLGMHQAEMAKLSPFTAFEIDRIEDNVTVSVIVPGTDGLNQESRVPYPLDAKPEPFVTKQVRRPVVSPPPSLEDTYRQEFRKYVVRPCYEGQLKKQGLSQAVTVEEFIAFAKRTGAYDSMQAAEDHVILQVNGKPKDDRIALYKMADLVCQNPEQFQ